MICSRNGLQILHYIRLLYIVIDTAYLYDKRDYVTSIRGDDEQNPVILNTEVLMAS